MHDTRIEMKDGSVFVGAIYEFRPEEGWMTIVHPDNIGRLYFKDMKSAVTEQERGSLRYAVPGTIQGHLCDCDELARARAMGWKGKKECCPSCGKFNFASGLPNDDEDALVIKSWCHDCGTEWIDRYEWTK